MIESIPFVTEHLTTPKPEADPELAPIPWPEEFAPEPVTDTRPAGSALPKADVLIVMWTVAEAQACADVLTPGVQWRDWVPYTHHMSLYEPHLTWKSPAKEAGMLGCWHLTRIGDLHALVMKFDLHLSTDDATLPVRALWKQVIQECAPQLVITTGTAGGIGADTVLGDVLVTNTARFDCSKMFADQSFAQSSYSSFNPHRPVKIDTERLAPLLAANADRMKPIATRDPIVEVTGTVVSTDFFAFDDSTDHYGLRAYDPTARMVEMDDAVLGLVCAEDLSSPPPWVSIRNASDPQISSSVGDIEAQAKQASHIYLKYGYWTTVDSALACWDAVVGIQTAKPVTPETVTPETRNQLEDYTP